MLAVRRFRRLAFAGRIVVAGVLFVAGAIGTANERAHRRHRRPRRDGPHGALLVAVVAGAMVGQLKGRLERQQLAALGPWLAGDRGRRRTGPGRPRPPRSGRRRTASRSTTGPAAGPWRAAAPAAQAAAALAGGARPCGLCEPGPVG